MKVHPTGLVALGMVILGIYLFASAPPPLQNEAEVSASAHIPIDRVLETIAAENDAVRMLYTREIVGKGKTAGLAFDEFWRKEEIQAGPLPALFLGCPTPWTCRWLACGAAASWESSAPRPLPRACPTECRHAPQITQPEAHTGHQTSLRRGGVSRADGLTPPLRRPRLLVAPRQQARRICR